MLSKNKLFLAGFIIIVAISLAGWGIWLWSLKTPTNGNADNTNTANANISNTNAALDENANSQQSNANSASIDTSDWQTYRNEELGFEMKYPEEFKVAENNPSFNFNPNAEDQTNVSFENSQIINDCGCGIYIRVEDNNKLFSIDGWLNSDEQKNDNYISQKQYDERKNITDEAVRLFAGQYSEETIKINGLLSLRQNYATEGGGYDRVLISKNDKIYVITARSDSYYFNKKESQKDGGKLADISEKMLQNFILL